MRRLLVSFFACLGIFIFFAHTPSYAAINIIHEFDGDNGDAPYGSVIEFNDRLYGMTSGENYGNGVIFSMESDGEDYTVLHNFDATAYPSGDLTVVNDMFYGMTYGDGTSSKGTIFRMSPDGSGYTVLHNFAGGGSDGSEPFASLHESNGVFYGTTQKGGDNNAGVIFKINVDGSGFSLLHEFTGGDDGKWPTDNLLLINNELYGSNSAGSLSNSGTIFKINIDGTGFTVLHQNSYLQWPGTLLVHEDGILYGITNGGNTYNSTIFSMNSDGSNYQTLYELDFATEGGSANGGVTLVENTLYGMTEYGGEFDLGTFYKVDLDGSNFTVLHTFSGTPSDGSYPEGRFNVINNRIYGTTWGGGADDYGIVFYYQLPDVPTPTATPTPTSTPASQASSTSSGTVPDPKPQIPSEVARESGGTFTPLDASGNQVLSLHLEPHTFDFNAFVSAENVTPEKGLLPNPMTGVYEKAKSKMIVMAGDILGIQLGKTINWQIGSIHNVWYKAYAPGYKTGGAAKIIPELQSKPSIISLSYTDADLIPPGKPKSKFNAKNLKLAYSPDGVSWKILPTSVVDTTNHTVAALHKIGGYYMIAAL